MRYKFFQKFWTEKNQRDFANSYQNHPQKINNFYIDTIQRPETLKVFGGEEIRRNEKEFLLLFFELINRVKLIDYSLLENAKNYITEEKNYEQILELLKKEKGSGFEEEKINDIYKSKFLEKLYQIYKFFSKEGKNPEYLTNFIIDEFNQEGFLFSFLNYFTDINENLSCANPVRTFEFHLKKDYLIIFIKYQVTSIFFHQKKLVPHFLQNLYANEFKKATELETIAVKLKKDVITNSVCYLFNVEDFSSPVACPAMSFDIDIPNIPLGNYMMGPRETLFEKILRYIMSFFREIFSGRIKSEKSLENEPAEIARISPT